MKRMILFSIIICSICSMMLSGCVTPDDIGMLNNRIAGLDREYRELGQRYTALKSENERLAGENQRIKSEVESYAQTREQKDLSLRSQSAGLTATFEQIKEELQRLNGRMEENEHAIQRLKNEQNALLKKLETARPAHTDLRQPDISSGYVPESTSAHLPGPPEPDVDDYSENELYDLSKQAFDRDNYPRALEGFQLFMKKFPGSRQADNAQFWIGETHYRQKQYEKAILAYQNVIEKYPGGNKIRASLLKQGFAFAEIGDRKTARQILEALISKYPDSGEARMAREKIKGL